MPESSFTGHSVRRFCPDGRNGHFSVVTINDNFRHIWLLPRWGPLFARQDPEILGQCGWQSRVQHRTQSA